MNDTVVDSPPIVVNFRMYEPDRFTVRPLNVTCPLTNEALSVPPRAPPVGACWMAMLAVPLKLDATLPWLSRAVAVTANGLATLTPLGATSAALRLATF